MEILFELVVSLKTVPSPLNASLFTILEVPFLYILGILKVLDLQNPAELGKIPS